MALNFYNQNTAANGAKKPAAPVQQARQNQGGQDLWSYGHLNTSQLEDPELGFGPTFQAASRRAGIEGLRKAQTFQNADDAAAQGELRDFYRQSLGGLGEMGDRRGTAFDTQAQRGAQNLLGQYQRSRAGTGRIGGRGEADIIQRLTEEYTKGVNDLGGQQLRDAGAIQGGLQGVVDTDMRERNFMQQQAKAQADFITQQQNLDNGREANLAASRGAEGNWMSSVLPAVGTIAGAAIPGAGPMGAMIGGQIGSAAGGAMGGGGGGAGSNPGMGLAQLMQQQQFADQLARNSSGGSLYGGRSYTPVSDDLQSQFNAYKRGY